MILDSTIPGRIVAQLLLNSIAVIFCSRLIYEPEIHQVLRGRTFTKPVIDGGAQSGHYSVLLSRAAPLVISIEPIPENYFLIRCLIRMYRLRNVVQFNVAIAPKDGTDVLHLTTDRKNSSLHETSVYSGRQLRVRTTRLSSLVTKMGGIGLVKLDIEGGEMEVIRESASVMNLVDEWLIEVHNPAQYQSIEAMLMSHGYCLTRLGYGHLRAFRPP